MRVERLSFDARGGLLAKAPTSIDPQFIIYFGPREMLATGETFSQLRTAFPEAILLGCTTGGQIHDHDGVDDNVAALAMHFEKTKLHIASEAIRSMADSRSCGRSIGKQLLAADLSAVFVLSDGLNVNGNELIAGITELTGDSIPLTGGLAGDGAEFKETLVGADCIPKTRTVAAIGFYGDAVRIGHGCAGGWDVFGPWRRITRSIGNILYELDGEPALNLYERYLGDEAKGLPGTGLLFPLQIHDPNHPDHLIVRTILAVDPHDRSLTFAGDVPQGWAAQLMRGNFNHLSAGAAEAARQAAVSVRDGHAESGVALLVSCIGRRLLMGQRISDELESVAAVLGDQFSRIGFYSYGEISPHAVSGFCELHNQTMTITTISEAA